MKVRMKEDKKGSPDGINVIDYEKGKTYDMPDVLAKPWIKKGLAVAVKPPKVEEEIEEPEAKEPEETKDDGLEEPKDEEPPEPKKKDKK